jgi:deazaflavin-dependent oxidoreductase (nitroreductase family)
MYRLIGIVGTSRIVTALHPVAYRLLGGAGPLGTNFGVRTVILTTTGRRSGRARPAPLYAFEDGDRIVVIGSNAGRADHPAWVENLRAKPRASVRIGRVERRVRAREAEGDERDRLWALAVDGFPGYAGYQQRATRRIPVVVLEPDVDPDADSGIG